VTPIPTRTPSRTPTGTPTITPTNTPVPAPLVIRVLWPSSAGCRDLNLFVLDPTESKKVPTTDANKGCASCVPNPFEEVSIPNPVSGIYTYYALDMDATDCACAGTISSELRVYRNGILVKTDISSSRCGGSTGTFTFTY